mmetsp:Transcript_26488/g.35423  ORF Transcript_26488/g.35423 Transcript_26488/m.35423 type:complete len:105 (+) Transcript_26488:464-778(+)
MPEYELEVYRKAGKKTQMDPLNFNKEQTIVLEGHCLPDLPLASSLCQHRFNEATITQLAREIDPKKKYPFAVKNETYGIYGLCDFESVSAGLSNSRGGSRGGPA